MAPPVEGASAAVAAPRDVYVQGDSLTVDAASYLKKLAAPSNVTVDAKIGRHAYEGVALIRRKLMAMPDTVVVALGSNDDHDAMGVKLFRGHVNSIMAMLGSKRCVIWTTIYQQPKKPKPGKPKPPMVFDGLNGVIDEAAGTWRNIRRVPWAEIAAKNPAWFKYDSLHPTTAGYEARAQATLAAIRRCPASTRSPGGGNDFGGATPAT